MRSIENIKHFWALEIVNLEFGRWACKLGIYFRTLPPSWVEKYTRRPQDGARWNVTRTTWSSKKADPSILNFHWLFELNDVIVHQWNGAMRGPSGTVRPGGSRRDAGRKRMCSGRSAATLCARRGLVRSGRGAATRSGLSLHRTPWTRWTRWHGRPASVCVGLSATVCVCVFVCKCVREHRQCWCLGEESNNWATVIHDLLDTFYWVFLFLCQHRSSFRSALGASRNRWQRSRRYTMGRDWCTEFFYFGRLPSFVFSCNPVIEGWRVFRCADEREKSFVFFFCTCTTTAVLVCARRSSYRVFLTEFSVRLSRLHRHPVGVGGFPRSLRRFTRSYLIWKILVVVVVVVVVFVAVWPSCCSANLDSVCLSFGRGCRGVDDVWAHLFLSFPSFGPPTGCWRCRGCTEDAPELSEGRLFLVALVFAAPGFGTDDGRQDLHVHWSALTSFFLWSLWESASLRPPRFAMPRFRRFAFRLYCAWLRYRRRQAGSARSLVGIDVIFSLEPVRERLIKATPFCNATFSSFRFPAVVVHFPSIDLCGWANFRHFEAQFRARFVLYSFIDARDFGPIVYISFQKENH